MGLESNGLSSGIVPSELILRIFPAREDKSCDHPGLIASPVVMYSFPSGPKFILQPSCHGAPGMPSMITCLSVNASPLTVKLKTLFWKNSSSRLV